MKQVLRHLDQRRAKHLEELMAFLRIPSISTKPEHRDDVRTAARWVADQLSEAGLHQVKICETPGHPVVIGQTPQVPKAPTVLFYGHYDVQPAEPLGLWKSPPFDPEIRRGKLYARGAADDKGQVFLALKAIEAFMRVEGGCPINVKVLLEGEEEIGSPNLVPFVRKHRKELNSDVVLVCDTEMQSIQQPSITRGLRGLASLEVRVVGAAQDLHSGRYGGAVANPIHVLSRMISRCHDAKTGKVKVPGFYEAVRRASAAERRELKASAYTDKELLRDTRAPQLFGEQGYCTAERLGIRPTLEVNGIWGGYTGEGLKTVLPSSAHAKLSMRLVPNQEPDTVTRQVADFLLSVAPPHVRVEVKRHSNSGLPVIVDHDTPAMQAAVRAVQTVFRKKPVFTLDGGSIPIVADFKRLLKRDTILLGFGLPDDNLHAPNEKFDLRMLDKGMKTLVHLFAELAGEAKA